MKIRLAVPEDAGKLLEIYTPYVRETAITLEQTVPSADEFRTRIENTLKNYPYLVAEEDGKIVGYAYGSSFHNRESYKHSAEVSIYVDREYHGQGIGKMLYQTLEEMLPRQNVFILHACIVDPEVPDEYVTNDSKYFHTKMGYTPEGKHDRCAFKFGRWYSVIWMEKVIAERPEMPEAFIPLSELGGENEITMEAGWATGPELTD